MPPRKIISMRGKLLDTTERTSSFGTSATANGLLGCTLGDVTDGHPFFKFQVSGYLTATVLVYRIPRQNTSSFRRRAQ